MCAPHQRDPTQPWRAALALGAIVIGAPYLRYVLEYVAPEEFIDVFSSPGYFAWFVGQAVLLGMVGWSGFAKLGRRGARLLAGLLAMLAILVFADDQWRLWIFGGVYRMVPMDGQQHAWQAFVHRWRSPLQCSLLLLATGALALSWPPARLRWWAPRLAVASAATAVPLGLAEVAFRAGWVDVPYTVYRGGSEVFRPNSLLGWSNAEGTVTEHYSPDFSIEVRINSRGERGPEIPFERVPGQHRILALGDSFTFGAGVEEGDTFAARLAAPMPANEVINAGVIGYSIDQEYLYLREFGLKYRPDEVVLGCFVGNDFGELGMQTAYGYGRPYFTLSAGRLELHPVAPESARSYETDPRPFSFRRASRAVQFAERLLALRRQGRGDGGPEASRTQARPVAPPPPGWLEDPRYAAPAPPEAALAQALLARIRDLCDEAGARLTVLLIPARETLLGPPEDGETGRIEHARELVTVRRICAALGIAVVDPTAELTARQAAGEGIHHPHDGHWTARGHELATEALLAAGVGR